MKLEAKIIGGAELTQASDRLRTESKRLVFTDGCFDLLHVSHVRYLQAARELGDALAVGINGDASVRALKGEGRPLNRQGDRAAVIAALESVDYVVVFPEVRATALLELIRPAIYAKGGDYTADSLNPEERRVLEAIGAEICIIPFESGYSTTSLIDRMHGAPPNK